MLHMTTLITTLSILTLSSALNTPPPPTLTNQPQTTCLHRPSSYTDSAYTTLFFSHPDEPLNLTIVTGYMKYYPQTLTHWLSSNSFSVHDATTLTNRHLCGWVLAPATVVNGRRHGSVGWQSPTARPRPDILRVVEGILKDNLPMADVWYLRAVALEVACGALGLMLLYAVVIGCVEGRRKTKALRTARDEAEEAVELDMIRLRHVDVVKTTDDGEVCSVADPPPVYSLDGAGPRRGW